MSTTFPRRRIAALLTPALALASFGASASASTEPVSTSEPDSSAAAESGVDLSGVTLRVGDQLTITQTGLEAAGQSDTPYTIEWASFPSGPPLLEALNADAIDIGPVGDAPPIFAAAAGADIRVVLATATPQVNQGILVPAGSDIVSVADLEGKTIAVAKGSSANWILLKALTDHGLSVDDVTIAYLQPTDAQQAFNGGDVDAWAIWDPFASVAQGDGASLIISGADLGIPGLGFHVTSTSALEDPATAAAIRDYLSRIRVAQAWQRDHKDEWAQAYSELTGLDIELTAQLLRQDTEPVLLDDAVIAAQQAEADAFYDAGVIPTEVDFASIVDDQFNDVTELPAPDTSAAPGSSSAPETTTE